MPFTSEEIDEINRSALWSYLGRYARRANLTQLALWGMYGDELIGVPEVEMTSDYVLSGGRGRYWTTS